MKKTRREKNFVITSKDTGNILVMCKELAREGNPEGRTYVSWQHFLEFTDKIRNNNELGKITVFRTRREATKFAEQIGAKNYEVAESIPVL